MMTPCLWNTSEAVRLSWHKNFRISRFRKHFRLPAGSAGQKIFIEFEGLRKAGLLPLPAAGERSFQAG